MIVPHGVEDVGDVPQRGEPCRSHFSIEEIYVQMGDAADARVAAAQRDHAPAGSGEMLREPSSHHAACARHERVTFTLLPCHGVS
jgi:hypothetical protein